MESTNSTQDSSKSSGTALKVAEKENSNSKTSTENVKKQYSAEDMKREFEKIKEEWIKKKIDMPELTDKILEKISEAKEFPEEYCKFCNKCCTSFRFLNNNRLRFDEWMQMKTARF